MTAPRTPDYLDFGRYLQLQRERRGLSLDDISRQTKIPRTLLGALETGQAERFPERVFVLNSIRSYASAVGLSPDDALGFFQEIPGAPQAEPFDPVALEAARRERASTALWATGAIALLVSVLVALNAMYDLAIRYTHR